MIRIRLEGVSVIEDLVEFIKTSYASHYRRIWQIHERTIGIFLHESIGIPETIVYSVITTLDHSKSDEGCELSIMYAGGSMSLIGLGRFESFTKRMKDAICELAEQKGWRFKVERMKVKPAGEMCPHCGAAYRYSHEKIREDGTVICQNCAKVFSLQKG
ncbi:MAG: MJ0042-type zinc finger domain-containing protein [Candidatus Sifarchaeia archaeon]